MSFLQVFSVVYSEEENDLMLRNYCMCPSTKIIKTMRINYMKGGRRLDWSKTLIKSNILFCADNSVYKFISWPFVLLLSKISHLLHAIQLWSVRNIRMLSKKIQY